MPGITGIISENNEKELHNAFLSSLKHLDYRSESFQEDGVHIGRVFHGFLNRDPQPVFSDNRRFVLFFYGEIFAFRNTEAHEIKDDAKFFLQVFQESERDALSDINGQFVAVVYDFQEKKTYLISDKMGTKPMYYTVNHGRLLFSSEVKTLLKDRAEYELNWAGISDLFHFGHLWGDKTLFKEILLLPPASCLMYQKGQINISRYWELPYDREVYHGKQKFSRREKQEYIDGLADVLSKAMKRTFARKRENLLFPLSGGLDSRFVVAFAGKYGVAPLKTFTMGPDASEDQIYASKVAELLGAVHESFQVNGEDVWDDAGMFSFLSDGMAMIYGPVAINRPLQMHYKQEEFIVAPQMSDAVFGNTLQHKKVKEVIRNERFDEKSSAVFQDIFNLQDETELKRLFMPEFYEKIKDEYRETPQGYMQKYKDPPHSYYMMLMNEHGRRGTLGGNVLINRYFEITMPSYDTELLEYGFLLPMKFREFQYAYRMAFAMLFPSLTDIPRQGVGLPIDASNFRLRQQVFINKLYALLRDKIPDKRLSLVQRKNKVTYVDFAGWFRGPMKEQLLSFMSGLKMTKEIFDQEGLEKIITDHLTGRRDHARLIWQVINLEYFYRNFIG